MQTDGEYNNFDGSFTSSRNFRTSDCLIVHGNTEHGGDNSLFKEWGYYSCGATFSAVMCQLDIDVHSNGGLQTTIPTTTSTTTSTTTTTTTTTSTTTTSSTTRRRMLRMAYHKEDQIPITSSERTTSEHTTEFETLPTLEVLNVSHIMSKIEELEEQTTTPNEIGMYQTYVYS